MFRLLAIYGDEEQIFVLPEGEAKLGSAPGNDFVLRVSGVSRKHALVRPLPDGIEIVDLGSKNGLLVNGKRMERVVLKPGASLQIGAAWLTVEEVSASEEALALLTWEPAKKAGLPPFTTSTAEAGGVFGDRTPADAALALAYHLVQGGRGIPGERDDLLARITETLGAEAFGAFESVSGETLRIWEVIGEFSTEDMRLLTSLAASPQSRRMLKRAGRLLLAGRDAWFLGARFAKEVLARERWREEFLRFLAAQFYMPVRSLDQLNASEAARVLALAGDNKRRTAELLKISPGTLYKLLDRHRKNKP